MASFSLARAYQRSFEARPNGTLAIAGGCLNALGDGVAQITQNVLAEEHEARPGYDALRTLRFFAFGFALSPLVGRWNLFLEHRFPLRAQPGVGRVSLRALGKRLACDQIAMAPLGIAVFIGTMGVLEGNDVAHIRQRYSDIFLPALLTNWKVWPLAQLVNFRYMPLAYRVPFSQTCGVFWTVYLSILNSKEDQKQDRTDAIAKTLG
ncbi:hypothetical protein PLICRDRAFT_171099 [Plicaturopsis crispa FD-325 SS-3]|nr:hypothetical protein PLICRDRAFT_171099 [Plicaturopsis crispa FD-325 SS-3]